MTDIVERLVWLSSQHSVEPVICLEGADEIVRLRINNEVRKTEIERLRHMYEAAHVDSNAAIERQRLEIERLRAEVERL